MSYIGQRPVVGRYIKLDQISSGFNGSSTSFSMTAGSQAVSPGTARNLLLSLGGVIQEPDTDYTVLGSTLTFTTAPTAGSSFFGVVFGDMQSIATPSDGTVLPASIASSGDFAFPADVRLKDSDGSHYVGFQAASTVSSNVVWTLPSADAGASGYALVSDGSGTLSWAAVSGGLSSDAQQNTVGGTNAGDSFTGTDANNNTLIGFDAGTSITSADHSTALGKDALKSVTTAYGNMGLGRSAGDSLTTGQQNTCVGLSAGHSLTTQSQNVCVGEDAMAQTKGTENTSVGFQSMSLAYFGDYNVALGSKALKVVGGSSDGSGGDYNVAIGYKAGDALETGSNCIIIGKNAAATSDSTSNEITLGDANITKFRVPGIDVILKDNGGTPTQGHVLTVDANGEAGFAAAAGGLSSDAQYNTVGGTNAGDSFTGTDATDNTLIGYDAGTALTTGDRNTVTGSGCGDSMTTTSFNTGMGYQALSSLTTGSQHVAIGDWASKSVVGGNYSTAVGSRALYNATAGFNEAFGREALYACT